MTSTTDLAISPQALTRLRAGANQRDPEALKVVAKEFEALFLREILRNVRDGALAEDVLGSDDVDFYQDLYDAQLASSLAGSGGFGLAKIIEKQLAGMVGEVPLQSPAIPPEARAAPQIRVLPVEREAEEMGVITAPDVAVAPVATADFAPASQEEFVRQLLPYARRAADELGIAPAAIIAQAALESGWGKRMPHQSDGRSSFNLFGIKAGSQWTGARAHVATLEYVDGMAVRSRAQFRSYDSLEHAMQDYVQLVGGSERYRAAVRAGTDSHAYATALARAGYATDPAYASKLHAILDRPLIQGLAQ